MQGTLLFSMTLIFSFLFNLQITTIKRFLLLETLSPPFTPYSSSTTKDLGQTLCLPLVTSPRSVFHFSVHPHSCLFVECPFFLPSHGPQGTSVVLRGTKVSTLFEEISLFFKKNKFIRMYTVYHLNPSFIWRPF